MLKQRAAVAPSVAPAGAPAAQRPGSAAPMRRPSLSAAPAARPQSAPHQRARPGRVAPEVPSAAMTVRPPAPPASGRRGRRAPGKPPRAPTRAVGASKVSKPVQQMDAGGAPNVTSVEYWDKVADAWQGEIHNSLREDTGRVIQTALDHFAQGAPLVLDLGCGVGNYLPSIAFRALKCVGVDISPQCVTVARRMAAMRGLRNVTVKVGDLGRFDLGAHGLGPASCVVCANVLISPEPVTRREILCTIYRALQPPECAPASAHASAGTPEIAWGAVSAGARTRAVGDEDGENPGGALVLVVPAAESGKLVQARHREWVERRRRRKLRRIRGETPEETCDEDEAAGIFRRCGVRTKHFSKPELLATLQQFGFEVIRIQQVVYKWDTEFEPPTSWMGAPYPFDWLATARRVRVDPEPPLQEVAPPPPQQPQPKPTAPGLDGEPNASSDRVPAGVGLNSALGRLRLTQ